MAHQKVIKVKAGKNTCDICSETAYFSLRLEPHGSQFELLGCGHGICKLCYDEMRKRSSKFACPYCRSGGVLLINLGGAREKRINTFSEFVEHWEHKEHLLSMYQGVFMTLYREICKNAAEENVKKREKREALKIKKAREDKKAAKKLSRESAGCKYCNKDTFTSMKQLEVHISKKHAQV